ncbi:MAG: hypothetical protein ACRC7N_13710 [Clostridium sp.]
MIKSIESNLYKITKSDNYDDDMFEILIKETDNYITVYRSELPELTELLNKAEEILD